MRDVDYFIMDYWPALKQLDDGWLPRGHARKLTLHWVEQVVEQSMSQHGIRLNVRMIENGRDEDGLDFAVRARKLAFEESNSDLFVLSDNDIVPFNAQAVSVGLDQLDQNDEFAILSAMPQPHTIKPMSKLDGRTPIVNHHILEHYACGGLRFCRRVNGLQMPDDRIPGYDGKFCRYLWSGHGKRVGYLKQANAFHLGTHCTSLW